MSDLFMLLLLVVAIAIGYFLGRRGTRTRAGDDLAGAFDRNYFKGLNQLLNEQPDAAIDTFIRALEVNSDTLETHLALGNLLRRQGEVDRAIRIHQNLLARPGLPPSQQHHAQLELARDYVKAGLLDRAERLFQELVEQSPELRDTCLEGLVEIYRDEQEWEKAINAVEQLVGRRFGTGFAKVPAKWRCAQAHFCCELAEQAMGRNDFLTARRYLKSALGYDKNLVRASLLWGQLEYQLGHGREALKILKKIPSQDADFLVEALPLFVKCHEQLGDYQGLQKFLLQLQSEYPSNSIILELTERIRQTQGDMAAASFIGTQLKSRPSVRGVSRLLDFYVNHSKEKAQENLRLLKELIDQIIVSKPAYRCEHCGFTGNQLHWLCPSCKSWNTVKAIRGVEGE
ncbi:lipopolysaccharide assembly protein LapB [Gilvimarinus sp. F26214L]|uniref:lipopolysaccharide assembly protein LapB n=1 Tax=Gilvimarinus sp. DZF01 TaxID=3461371 RepID=UPI0040454F7C